MRWDNFTVGQIEALKRLADAEVERHDAEKALEAARRRASGLRRQAAEAEFEVQRLEREVMEAS